MNLFSTRQVRWIIKPLWHTACLAPFVWISMRSFDLGGAPPLGADPIEETQNFMGIWALRLLLVTLAITPLRQLTGQLWLMQLRRMTGLYALFYVSMHLLNYLIPDQGLNWPAIFEDVLKRTFITIGAVALLGLTLLGVTSTRGWQRRLGSKWQKLHWLIYPIAILAVWHFWWQVKQDIREPLVYATVLSVLLGYRVYRWRRRKNQTAPGFPDAA